jgi:Rrf2 family protein
MSLNSQFAVAIHALTLLAYAGPEPITSEFIAGSVMTNPVVIRRVMALLRAAKLVRSRGGPGGGWQLVRAPAAITLRDVYRAVASGALFALQSSSPNPRCPVGRTIQGALTSRFDAAHLAMERDLEHTTVADLLADVERAAR